VRGVAVPPLAPVPQPGSGLATALTGFPPRILAAFAARPPPPHWAPEPKKPPRTPYSGVGDLVRLFEEGQVREGGEAGGGGGGGGGGDTPMGEEDEEGGIGGRHPPSPPPSSRRPFRNRELGAQARIDGLLPLERLASRAAAAEAAAAAARAAGAARRDAATDPAAAGTDPDATLFLGRLPYAACDGDSLRREWERVGGPIKGVTVVVDAGTGAPRGYAFVEFEAARDARRAADRAGGGQRGRGGPAAPVVELERGRTEAGWLPTRLGGGLGGGGRAPREPRNPKSRERRGLAPLVGARRGREGWGGAGAPPGWIAASGLASAAQPPPMSGYPAPLPPLGGGDRYGGGGDRGGGGGGGDWRDADRGRGGWGGGGLSAPRYTGRRRSRSPRSRSPRGGEGSYRRARRDHRDRSRSRSRDRRGTGGGSDGGGVGGGGGGRPRSRSPPRRRSSRRTPSPPPPPPQVVGEAGPPEPGELSPGELVP
jgi:U1 small nuclear ribonucleoprotein